MNHGKECKMNELRKALVVDDDDDFLMQQKTALEVLGFAVETAGGRLEAEEKLKIYKPDLAMVDLMMEEKDGGFVLARHLKQANPKMIVVLVTAVTAETGLKFDMESAGASRWIKADAMLTKPVRMEQLKREIARLMP
jgi:CheY-like chemotaxis protein